MKKISMIMPVYNEEKLIKYHLDLASLYLDEIIIVDGSPTGPSTDESQNIARKYDNVKIVKGKFEMSDRKGGWNKAAQIQTGVDKASGDILVFTSVDTMYSDYKLLVETIKAHPNGKVFFCPTIEFFIDTKHIRMVYENGFPHPQVGYTIVDKNFFTSKEYAFFESAKIKQSEYVYLHNCQKFHYGWITDFDIQIRKHIRNLKSALWKEYGESILAGGAQAMEVWAITHVINYPKEVFYPYVGYDHPLRELKFSYLNKIDQVLAEFKRKYKTDYYDCI